MARRHQCRVGQRRGLPDGGGGGGIAALEEGKVALEMQEDEKRWAKLPKHFTRPLCLMMGGFGGVEVRQGLLFDPKVSDWNKVGRMYSYAKPELDRGWNACKRGLFAKEEPHVNVSKE